MQMMNRNKNGITLIALVITIVVLLIILGITLNYGISEIHTVSNKKIESELSIVQEAIMQRYALAKSANKLGVIAKTSATSMASDVNRPSEFLGTRLLSSSDINSYGFSGITYMQQYSNGTTDLEYEKYYYLLNESDLNELGIEKGDDGKERTESTKGRSYVVNYFTGEVFDVANKKYYNTDNQTNEQVYTQPTSIDMDQQSYDFNDN